MLYILPVVTCMTEDALFTWTVVLPVKVLARAKSRLALLAGARRADLALALASDTVSAVVACPDVTRVLVVTSDAKAGSRLAALGAIVAGAASAAVILLIDLPHGTDVGAQSSRFAGASAVLDKG
ncbi:MAG: hypothetical protein WA794_27885, partial [Trebonia sp.]